MYKVVMKYDADEQHGLTQLALDITDYITKGWMPQGGVSITFIPDLNMWLICQAIYFKK